MTIWFTADQHFGHAKIMNYCNRDYVNVNEMNWDIIKKHNELVAPEDTVYHLGDFALAGRGFFDWYKQMLYKLNGDKHLILGSHDNLKPFDYVEVGFTSVHTALELNIDGLDIVLVHDPAASFTDREKIFICGHVHDLFKTKRNVINVGVDVWDYKPVSLEEIKRVIDEDEILRELR